MLPRYRGEAGCTGGHDARPAHSDGGATVLWAVFRSRGGAVVRLEGQGAIALEATAEGGIDGRYDFEIEEGEPAILDFRPVIVSIVRDISSGRRVGEISARFHNTLSVAIGEVCGRIGSSDAVDRVCLSGGSFQNLYLLGRTVVELRRRSFDGFLHAQVPANDGGITLGQAMVANEHLHQGE